MSSGLMLVLSLLALMLGVWALRVRRTRHRRRISREEVKRALGACTSLIDMLAALQQHRGLSTGWLAGDKGFERRMLARRRDIGLLMPALMRAAELETGAIRPCFTVNDASVFRHRWKVLVDDLGASTPEQNIGAHTRQIERLTAMIAALGEARIELPAASELPVGMARSFACRLPALSECLGQTRAIGSAAAAAGYCAPVARVRLMFLVSRAESLLRQAAELDAGQHAMLARQHVERLARQVRTGLLGAAGTSVSADAFFATATTAIDCIFDWIRANAEAIEKCMHSPGAARAASNTIPVAAAGTKLATAAR